jgi:AAA domain
MKGDVNDTLRLEGEDAVRFRHDKARRHRRKHRSNANDADNAAERFKLVAFNDLLASTTALYLIKGLIPRVGLTVVWGPPKSGKSFKTFDAMMHVALDWPYRGRRVQQGPVVYAAFEGASGYGRRAEAFRRHHQLDDNTPVPFFLVPARMDFIREHALLIAAIRLRLGTTAPVAIVLDTLNRS